ncbi:MAG: methyltransferase domain-containing protein, partial [Candidatus Marinimicrobia bacterium]|nr:methyltransferase domain-containing protein [Candidatus Neomarinimicrobiota bacterium]
CFLAARRVGKSGKVICVDMTPEMIENARANALRAHFENVEFRLGEIEHLPVADNSVDIIISNCVVNLVPDKRQVFNEAFRVLKPGGRLMISDIVLLRELPAVIRESIMSYVGCVAGAVLKEDYLSMLRSAGFSKIEVVDEIIYQMEYPVEELNIAPVISKANISAEELKEITNSVVSIKVKGMKE